MKFNLFKKPEMDLGEAAKYISGLTQIPLETVERVLIAETDYMILKGIAQGKSSDLTSISSSSRV